MCCFMIVKLFKKLNLKDTILCLFTISFLNAISNTQFNSISRDLNRIQLLTKTSQVWQTGACTGLTLNRFPHGTLWKDFGTISGCL